MTIGGFIIMAVIVFAVFALWYRYVHRNGVYNAAAPEDDQRMANMRGTDRPRPTKTNAAFGTETGTIGERKQGRDGYTSSSYEYMGENSAVTDDSSQHNKLLPNGRGQVDQQTMKSDQSLNSPSPVKLAAASGSAFVDTEIGVQGSNQQYGQAKSAQSSAQAFQNQNQAQQGGQGQQNQQVQQYQTEIGSMGGNQQATYYMPGQQGPSQGGQNQGAQNQGAQNQGGEREAVKTAESSAQVFQAETGTIGDVQQGRAGSVVKNQDPNQALPQNPARMGQDSYHPEFGSIRSTPSGVKSQGLAQTSQGAEGQMAQSHDAQAQAQGNELGQSQVVTPTYGSRSAQSQSQQQGANMSAANQQYSSEIGSIGGTDQVPGRSKRQGSNAAQSQGKLASLYAAEGIYGPHNYTAEVGSIGDMDIHESPAHRTQRDALQAQINKYTVEAGDMGYRTFPDQVGLAQATPKQNGNDNKKNQKNRKKNKK